MTKIDKFTDVGNNQIAISVKIHVGMLPTVWDSLLSATETACFEGREKDLCRAEIGTNIMLLRQLLPSCEDDLKSISTVFSNYLNTEKNAK